MRIVITGADGFIARNLSLKLKETAQYDQIEVTRETSDQDVESALQSADFVFHLAGVNRPVDPADFNRGNADLTARICEILSRSDKKVPIVLSSSHQASQDHPYGVSKRLAEQHVRGYAQKTGAAHWIYRLPNVFGKWARPNYNSAVATFCHNIARNQPIMVHDRSAPLRLLYIDDLLASFLALLGASGPKSGEVEAGPVYETSVGSLADMIKGFHHSRETLLTDRVGTGLIRALHATYLSHLPPESFGYSTAVHADARGEFVEMLKTPDCGQMSYFTAHPGVTRGGHYHHSKTEKFLVIRGKADFGFRNMATDETLHIIVEGGAGRIIETVPGWTHDITNIGSGELVVMLWANEVFDRHHPDTIAQKVSV